MNHPSQVPSNYYQPAQQQQQQQQQLPAQTYHPTDFQQTEINNYPQQWSQPTTQPDLNSSSQIPSTNTSYYQPPHDQSTSYIQPGLTSTPNPYPSQQPSQSWHPPEQNEQRDRLPSNEVRK